MYRTVAIIAVVFAATLAHAAGGACPTSVPAGVTSCYYIAANGADTNTGVDKTHPWLHAPSMTGCANNCSAHTPAPGEGYILRGGDKWHFSGRGTPVGLPWGQWQWGGSSGSPIYIGVDPTWFTGGSWTRPVLTGDNPISTSPVASCTAGTDTGAYFQIGGFISYVIIDNFEGSGICYNNGPSAPTVFAGNASTDHITWSNNYVHGWTRTTSCTGTGCATGPAMFAGDSHSNAGLGNTFIYNVLDGADSEKDIFSAILWDCYDVHFNVIRNAGQGIVCNNEHTVHDNLIELMTEAFPSSGDHSNGWEFNSEYPGNNNTYNNIVRNTTVAVTTWNNPNATDYHANNIIYNTAGQGWDVDVTGGGTQYLFNSTIQGGGIGPSGGSWSAHLDNNIFIDGGTTATPTSNTHLTSWTSSQAATAGYTSTSTYAYQPSSPTCNGQPSCPIGNGGNDTSFCSAIPALCSDTSYACSYNAGTHTVTCPARTVVARPSSGSWDGGSYQSTGGGGGGGGANYPYGSNCTNGCGQPATGNIIIPSSINCELHDSAGTNHIQCQAATKNYGQDALPLTIDGTQLDVYWQNTVPASCGIVLGALANNSDRDQWQYDSPGVFHIGTSCHVTIKGLVPASANGNGADGPTTFYLVSNPSATTSDPKGRYSPTVNTFPGPQCYNGSTACYFNVAPPNPTGQLPLQWNGTPAGVVRAIRGHQAEIPLNILWVGGNATTIAWFNTNAPCGPTRSNYLAHVYAWSGAGGWAAPNSGTWYTCKQVSGVWQWASNGSSLPAFVATSVTAVDHSGNSYTCPGSVNGGEDPANNYVPKDLCSGSSGSLGASITPFYPGQWVNGGAATDYRAIHYNSAKGYWMDTNAASTPFNAQPTALLQYYPNSTAVTGDVTVTACFDTYTDTTLTTKAGGTSNFCIPYTITVADETLQSQSDPPSYPADSNEPAYHNNLVTNAIAMCSNTGGGYDSVDYFNLGINYWMWLTMSPGDWGQTNTGNYDNSRVFSQTQDFVLAKMDGTAWPAWAPATTYGNAYAAMEVTDTNGHIWVATVNGGVSGGSIAWPTTPTPGQTKTDNTQTWRYVGDGAYWRRCASNAAVPYMNQSVQQVPAPWGQFPGGIFKLKERTGDAVTKGTTTYQGVLSAAVKNQINASFGAGAFSQFSASAGRPPAYELMSLAVYARTVCEQGNCAAFFGNPEMVALSRWDQNAIINYSDIHIGSDPISTDYTRTYWPTFDPLHIGVGQMALREWFIRMNELGHPELIDPRIVPEVKRILDFAWTHWYDQCAVQGGTAHNYSLSYNPMDFQTCPNGGQPGILEPYYTELTGTIQTSYDWIWRYCGGDTTNCKLSDGTAYNVAGNTIRRHQYDGRNCSNPQGHWYCNTYGIAYTGCTGAPKPFGQCDRETTGNSLQYNYGIWSWNEDDQSPQHNPCWTGGTAPCSTPQPYPDTAAPYGVQLLTTGQDDPTCEAHYTGQTCSPVQNVTSTSAVFQMNFYEQLNTLRWDYGTDQTCTTGSVTFTGTPTLVNGANQLYQYLTPVSGLLPNTQYYARYCATDAAGNTGCNTCTAIPGGFRGGKINFTTAAATGITIITTSLPNGSVGNPYSSTLQAAGGTPPYTWCVLNSGGTACDGTQALLPPGLSLNTSTGALTGTPTTGGVYPFKVRVTDTASNSADQPLSITISNLSITTSSLPAGTFGSPYSATLAATGGFPPYTWSTILGVLPTGLSLDPSTGAITGTPTKCGTYPVTWKVTDSTTPTPLVATRSLPIAVGGCTGTLTLTCPTFPTAIVNQVYPTQSCTIVGGVSPYVCSISAGALPAGLAVGTSGATCTISGTPTATGLATFTVHVHDSTGTPLTADSPGSINVISPGQFGVTVTGSSTFNGSVTIGSPQPPSSPGSPVGP